MCVCVCVCVCVYISHGSVMREMGKSHIDGATLTLSLTADGVCLCVRTYNCVGASVPDALLNVHICPCTSIRVRVCLCIYVRTSGCVYAYARMCWGRWESTTSMGLPSPCHSPHIGVCLYVCTRMRVCLLCACVLAIVCVCLRALMYDHAQSFR